MYHLHQNLGTSGRGAINRSGILTAICACALAFFGIAGSAHASATASISLGSNAAGSPTTAKIAVALSRPSGTVNRVLFNLPASLALNSSALADDAVCAPEVVAGSNPIGDCPVNSIFGHVELKTPLSTAPLVGSVIAYDTGGAVPGLALVAVDQNNTITSRSLLAASLWYTPGGQFIQVAGDVGAETPISALKINLSESPAGQFLRVGSANYCYAKDALDTALTNSRGELSYAISTAVSFAGCGTGGLITSGPATGSLVFGGTATFNFQYTGTGTFTGFRCALVRVSDEMPVGDAVDCGTVASGSTKTYTGLSKGVYMFRVSTLGFAPAVVDMRKFRVY